MTRSEKNGLTPSIDRFYNDQVNVVDPKATKETKSLFLFLNRSKESHLLFGHQHATTQGVTITTFSGIESDVKNAVGDYPAVYGWDTLSLHGVEEPFTPEATAEVMKLAYEREGIITLSAHLPNFVTGDSMYSLEGDVVRNILPDGSHHLEYTQFLDRIAHFAKELLVDSAGIRIPVIFRPFHEHNGDWFWWGPAHCSEEDYIHLFQFTVEYLRDVKEVHNFLYAFSPNGPFNGNEAAYLFRYPGDAYVDVLGYDSYDENVQEGWMTQLVEDAAMLVGLAEKKGKIPALTEVGAKSQDSGVLIKGNKNVNWWSDLLHQLKSDPEARRVAWLLTWRNGGLNHLWVPYANHPELGDNEMLDGFIRFYKDEWTVFNKQLQNVYKLIEEKEGA